MLQIKQHNGFTLIELMIVVAIIGILSTIAVPGYRVYVLRSRIAEGFALVPVATKAVANYYSNTGRMPKNNEIAGLPEPERIRGNYVASIAVEDGAIHIRLLGTDYGGDTISLRPVVLTAYPSSPTLMWRCGARKIEQNFTVFGIDKTNVNTRYLPYQCL